MIARPSSYPREAQKCDRIRNMNGYPKDTAPAKRVLFDRHLHHPVLLLLFTVSLSLNFLPPPRGLLTGLGSVESRRPWVQTFLSE